MKVETEIITACIAKDERAEYELYRLTYSYLMSICLRYSNDREEAREMLNLGFFKILTNLKKYQLETSFKAAATCSVLNDGHCELIGKSARAGC